MQIKYIIYNNNKNMQKSREDRFFTANNYVGKEHYLRKCIYSDLRHFIKFANIA